MDGKMDLSGISRFDRKSLKATTTQEKNILPTKDDIEKEKEQATNN